MATEIRKNKEGLYQLRSSVNEELLHDEEWITESAAKRILIVNRFYEFMEEVIKIDGDFPVGYEVDDAVVGGKKKGLAFILECYEDEETCDRKISDRYIAIKRQYKLNL